MASPVDLLYRFPDLADELIAKYYPASWNTPGNYKFPFVDVQFLIEQTKRHINGEYGPIQAHTVLHSLAFYSSPGEHGGVKAMNDIFIDLNNDHVIEQASASWEEYKIYKSRYRTLRKNVIRFFMAETRPLTPESRPPYECKTDSERRAWLQNYVELLEEYSAFIIEMHQKMDKLSGVNNAEEAAGPILPVQEEEWRRRCVECGGFGVGLMQPESIMCTHCQLQVHERRRLRSDSCDTESSGGDGEESRPWTCAVCTLNNAPSCDECVVCTSPRHVKPGDKIMMSRPWWTCAVCMVDNAPSCNACVTCTSLRHTAGPAEEWPTPPPAPLLPHTPTLKAVVAPPAHSVHMPPIEAATKRSYPPQPPSRTDHPTRRIATKAICELDTDGNKLQDGMKIEARHGGRSKWLKGTVLQCRPDGTYDIKYDDGDRETCVARDLIRNVNSLVAPTTADCNINVNSFFEDVSEKSREDSKRQKALDAALRRQPRSTSTAGDRKQYLLGIIRDGFSKRGEPVPFAIPSMTIEQLERVVKVWKLQE